MGNANVLLCLALCALVAAQAVDPVSVDGLTQVPKPSSPVSAISYVPGPFDSWATEAAPPTSVSAPVSSSNKSNKGKIAGGVVGGLAVVISAISVLVFLRFRSRRSTTHWRNRPTGAWLDQEGKAGGGGPVYVGQPPFDGYGSDSKVPMASPTTPVFIREPRLAYPFRGHTRGASHNRHDSMEMQNTLGSPTSAVNRF
ncbi:hypothetical protein C8R45DRAFT_982189 [Mycena sanguinolenta]|nr:hypothetical protein C8R45DRAFT_982189 [Mycena sanguinolenta]